MSNISTDKYKPFLQQLSIENKNILLLYGNEMSFKKNTELFIEGEEMNDIYLIRSGQILISKKAIDDKEFFLHIKGQDDIVGEGCMFNEMKANIAAKTISDTVVIRFAKHELEALFTQYSEIAIAFIRMFTRNTQSTIAKFSDLLLYGKTGAFYSTLIRFANSYGVETKDGIKLSMKLTNQDIAYFIGTSRETVNRMLNDLRKDDIIDIIDGYFIIKDLEFLKGHLHCGKCPLAICTIA